jgi:D-3-phosphoglycerate dehydrogenase
MLSRINEIFSRENINIDGQFLQTNATIGYVVADVTTTEAQTTALREALAAIPGTLRTRMLY